MHTEKLSAPLVTFGVTFGLTLVVWIIQCTHWNSMLDGDSALYSLMSLDVLKGRQYLYTAGQAHGGTLLVYVRALLFEIFGVSNFLGFFVNGIVVAISAALWAKFAAQIAGPLAGAVTGLFCALGSAIFAQYSCTDYYALALLCGGLMLQTAWRAARSDTISVRMAAWCGFLLGFSFYLCRFTPLHAIVAFGFYLALCPPQTRALLVPALQKGKVNRFLLIVLAVNTALFFPAFFTSDHFLGINAEETLKWSVGLCVALWVSHRWRIFFSQTALGIALGAFAGFLIGMAPHFAFKLLNPHFIDRTTGLARWDDLGPLLSDLPNRIAANFSRAAPQTYGSAAAICACIIVALGLPRKWARLAALLTIPSFASWLLIHTYMFLPVQYFYPVYFPLYLCLGISVASMTHWSKKLALLCLIPMAMAGMHDLYTNAKTPNYRLESGAFETFREWGVHEFIGDYWSSYDVMWASKAEFTGDPLHPLSKFPFFEQQVRSASTIGYLIHEGDTMPEETKNYTVVKSNTLNHGYRAELLQKKF